MTRARPCAGAPTDIINPKSSWPGSTRPPTPSAAAREAAHRAIEETQISRLSVEDQRAFVEAVPNPPPLTPGMERAIERYRTVITASR